MSPEIKEFEVNLPNAGETHKVSYTQWGNGENLLVCTHGLTRNGRDFDVFASEMVKHYTIIAPDMPGRGKSSWLNNHVLFIHRRL